ncbi:hypothetical protein F9K94_15690 [Brucella tritici]|jgi:hypothetical protein|uniref:Uncharacterized protein n=1 Tax=Brucella tritici TaxID=94626 RepID=A0A7V8B1K4_9HYPH|nr:MULTISPECIES: hypothetical protein [Brucella]KAB2655963.1 hypothetical protein F9K94_15690 [Brucella tritici]KXO77561.1 hypothetical protein AYJ56_20860 [Brucella anthropi]
MNDTASFPEMEDGEGVETATRFETVTYIEQMLEQLSMMAKSTNYVLLAYMIEMAHVEAREALQNESEA